MLAVNRNSTNPNSVKAGDARVSKLSVDEGGSLRRAMAHSRRIETGNSSERCISKIQTGDEDVVDDRPVEQGMGRKSMCQGKAREPFASRTNAAQISKAPEPLFTRRWPDTDASGPCAASSDPCRSRSAFLSLRM
jgi:hypothetical protein